MIDRVGGDGGPGTGGTHGHAPVTQLMLAIMGGQGKGRVARLETMRLVLGLQFLPSV